MIPDLYSDLINRRIVTPLLVSIQSRWQDPKLQRTCSFNRVKCPRETKRCCQSAQDAQDDEMLIHMVADSTVKYFIFLSKRLRESRTGSQMEPGCGIHTTSQR